jgi:PAS domain S-box-containing protein
MDPVIKAYPPDSPVVNIADALQQSEARFRAVFDSSAIGMGLLGLDGSLLQVNAAVCEISGYSAEELMQRNDQENIYPEDRDIDAEQARLLVNGELDSYQVEKRYVRKDGQVIWTKLTLSSVRSPAGKPLYLIGLIEDITEQKRVFSELQESEARFRAMFESSAIGVAVLDVKTLTLRYNEVAKELLQGAIKRQKIDSVYELVNSNYRQAERELFEELVNGQRIYYQAERRYPRPDGNYNCALVTFSAVRDNENQLRYIVALIEDITERKKAQERIKESEARFKAVFENAAVGISLIQPGVERPMQAVNPAVARMTGYSQVELMGMTHLEITYPDDLQIGDREYQEIFEGQRESYQVEKRFISKNGRVYWARLTVSAVRNEQGKPLFLVSITEDIDEQKRALEDLRQSEARFRTLFDTAVVGIGILGIDRRLIDINPALCQMFGWKREELLDQTSALVAHPDDLPRAIQYHQDLMEGKYTYYFDERRYIRKNGEVFWASVSMSLVRDENGKPLYIVGMVKDINEQKIAQDTLRESEARFQAVFDSAAVGIAMMTLDRRIVRVNLTAEHLTGYSAQELSQINPIDLAYETDRYIDRELFSELIAGQCDQYVIEKRYLRKDGGLFWGRVNFSLVCGPGGKPLYIIGIIEDITEEKRAAERLAAQEAEHRRMLELRITERTEELNKANQLLQQKATQEAVTAERTRLARDLHDAVTQTLFSATLIADVIPDLWENNAPEAKRRLEELRQLTRGALAEMRALLVELRPNALTEVPLSTLLRQLTEAITGRARINVQFNVDSDRKLPGEVQIALYRIAQEALNNIVKHGGATLGMVTLRLDDPVRLTVADNGAGFDPSTVTADHLGLKIMRERAEAIGAVLHIYSEPGEGTQISVIWQSDPPDFKPNS